MDNVKRITVRDLQKMKQTGQKIVTVTSYDAITARLVDEAGLHLILVGDSAGNTVLGYSNTIPVTMEESLMLTSAVRRGARRAMVIGDMPFGSYQVSPEEAVRNASRYLKECGADGVKLEGGKAVYPIIRRLVEASIPVMGHVGLLPQSVLKDGGYRAHGKSEEEAQAVVEDALAVQEAGAFAVVLECIPAALAERITKTLSIPTIGIGAGPHCDGQIQVVTDVLGLGSYVPRHASQFAHLADAASAGLREYFAKVSDGSFPGPENSI
ncbi:MAG: 3-methyl-2-oxobutanoate hydroxymethyltransferase [Victivallales bacterium]|nr:3-methyl-2-oxobutanoate hydroxymethyltransferase [Victivallales bacterium]